MGVPFGNHTKNNGKSSKKIEDVMESHPAMVDSPAMFDAGDLDLGSSIRVGTVRHSIYTRTRKLYNTCVLYISHFQRDLP